MDAVEYLKEKARMCDSLKKCEDCPLNKINNTVNINCFDRHYEEKAIAIVKKWAAEHPVKTRQSEFLKMFPNACVANGIIHVNPCEVDTTWIRTACNSSRDCKDCGREYWHKEVE